MTKPLRVNVEDLQRSATQISESAEHIQATDTASTNLLTSAQTGWIGTSAARLDRLATRWKTETQTAQTLLAKHQADLTTAANTYLSTEEANAAGVTQAGQPPAPGPTTTI
ncbi:WXG100 family type VII secretion target [Mycobacterium sp. 134]|uniref:WXG100 family type VII secretion target n=1 Tax=Mycobacterium sp. 134 TaxID=3400425 RepID=UPI003AAEB834